MIFEPTTTEFCSEFILHSDPTLYSYSNFIVCLVSHFISCVSVICVCVCVCMCVCVCVCVCVCIYIYIYIYIDIDIYIYIYTFIYILLYILILFYICYTYIFGLQRVRIHKKDQEVLMSTEIICRLFRKP